MPTSDHHSEYLARAVAGLTPDGRARVDELMEQLAEAVGDHQAVARFAGALKAEADLGRTDPPAEDDAGRTLTTQELGVLTAGFRAIRDQEPLDDVADWANAVVALLEDEAAHTRSD
jgi:hypothetical protein